MAGRSLSTLSVSARALVGPHQLHLLSMQSPSSL
jgi:hypothetical protein